MGIKQICTMIAAFWGGAAGLAVLLDMMDHAQYAMQAGIFFLLFGVLNGQD